MAKRLKRRRLADAYTFPGFAPYDVSKDCSAIPALGSLPSFDGEKNDLRHLWHGASQLVRPQAPAGTGFVLRPITAFTSTWKCVGSSAGGVAR